jgi:fructosamine-3-kinase
MKAAAADSDIEARIEAALGERPVSLALLARGGHAEVYHLRLKDGADLVAKSGAGGENEAYMLRYLAERSALPVPRVHYADGRLLVMDYIPAGDPIDPSAECHAAELLAALHDIGADTFGHECPTNLAGLPQPNARSARWLAFFRDQRLLYMAELARAAGEIGEALHARLQRFAERLGDFIDDAARPSLIHGDLWSGNILVRGGRVAGFIDPAIYYADAEIELAFATLFDSLGDAFFKRYGELRPLRPGFFETRRDIYNLYPLLVHARLFGGHYPDAVARILARFGA